MKTPEESCECCPAHSGVLANLSFLQEAVAEIRGDVRTILRVVWSAIGIPSTLGTIYLILQITKHFNTLT
jgi:hypothetical protein